METFKTSGIIKLISLQSLYLFYHVCKYANSFMKLHRVIMVIGLKVLWYFFSYKAFFYNNQPTIKL